MTKPGDPAFKKVKVFLGSANETAFVVHEFIRKCEGYTIDLKLISDHAPNLLPLNSHELKLGDLVQLDPWTKEETFPPGNEKSVFDTVIGMSRSHQIGFFSWVMRTPSFRAERL